MKQLFGILAVCALIFAFAPTHSGLHVGDTAPDFKLKDVSGKTVSLSDYTDVKGYVVTFTCNTCPYSVMYEDRLIELHNKYASKGYPVIAINPNDPAVREGDSFAAMGVRSEEKGFPFAYLFDGGQKVFPAQGATRTPHIFLLDSKRVVKYIGALDDNAQDAEGVSTRYVEDAIAAMESGKNPDPSL